MVLGLANMLKTKVHWQTHSACIGHHIPLVCSLDLHANIYDDMLLYWDHDWLPCTHEDQFETGISVSCLNL